jgi:hypothetical protein
MKKRSNSILRYINGIEKNEIFMAFLWLHRILQIIRFGPYRIIFFFCLLVVFIQNFKYTGQTGLFLACRQILAPLFPAAFYVHRDVFCKFLFFIFLRCGRWQYSYATLALSSPGGIKATGNKHTILTRTTAL